MLERMTYCDMLASDACSGDGDVGNNDDAGQEALSSQEEQNHDVSLR